MGEFWGPFWIVLAGALAGASCGLLGAYLVLRKMSLLGDALSHAVLPGIVIAFLLSGSRDVIPMFIGAAICGVIATVLIETFHRRWRVQEDSSIGIAFTALFALGVVLITAYAGQVDLDQECVLYGEIAYTPWDRLFWGEWDLGPRPIWILGTVFALNIAFVLVFFKELLIASFDAEMALSVGVSAALVHYMLMGAVSVTTVAAFESVGAILVVAMLIVPGASAYLWSDRLKVILTLSALMGVISAIAGYFLAGVWNSSIAGAMVVVMGVLFALSLIFAPHYGLLGRFVRQVRLSSEGCARSRFVEVAARAGVAACLCAQLGRSGRYGCALGVWYCDSVVDVARADHAGKWTFFAGGTGCCTRDQVAPQSQALGVVSEPTGASARSCTRSRRRAGTLYR